MTVSWVFLVVAMWGALYTLVSFRPPRRPGLLMLAGFFAAWATTELAPIILVIEIAGTAVFVALGALDHWPGWVGLAITAVSWFGLASSVKGAFQTRHTFAAACEDALGPNWDAGLDPRNLPNPGRLEWSRVFLPFHFKRKGVRRIRNLQYVDDGRRRHRLDVFHRFDTAPGAPVLLQIHGGAWVVGNKDQQAMPLMYQLANKGWVCVAINYGLSPRATWPDHLVDCKRALAWIREHIAEYGGDPDYVVVTGGSAGGHLTAMMGLTANDPAYQPGFEHVDTTLRAMVPFYGVFDWTDRFGIRGDDGLQKTLQRAIVKQSYRAAPDVYEEASPMHHIRPDAPPTLVVHGDLDTLAPVAEAREFVRALRATSREPVVYVELKGAHHAFEVFNSVRTLHVVAGIEPFLAWLVTRDRPARQGATAVPGDDGATATSGTDRTTTARTEA